MPRSYYITKDVEVEVRISINDLDREQILAMADEIQRKHDPLRPATGGPDYGELVISLGSWDALKFREAVARDDAYEVLAIVRAALQGRRAAA